MQKVGYKHDESTVTCNLNLLAPFIIVFAMSRHSSALENVSQKFQTKDSHELKMRDKIITDKTGIMETFEDRCSNFAVLYYCTAKFDWFKNLK